MKKYSLALLIFIEIVFIGIIGFLGYKIWQVSQDKVKGVYVTNIPKDNVILKSIDEFKYFYEPKSESIWKDKPEWMNYQAIYTINHDSLNERYDYSIVKPEKTYRIVAIGDSFTFGQYVDTQENFAEILEDSLNQLQCNDITHFDVINLGMTGYDISYAVQRFITRGIKYNPNLVIWLLNQHNLLQIKELMGPIRDEQNKKGINSFNPITRKFETMETARNIVLNQVGDNYIQEYQKKSFQRLYQNYKGNLSILSFQGRELPYRYIIDSFLKLSPNYMYYSKIFNTWNEEIYHFLDYHPNKEGHKKIASSILDFLIDNILTGCKKST